MLKIYWIKVEPSRGDPIFDLRNQHRKPFEICVVGRRGCSKSNLCRSHCLFSPPSRIHSKKPPVDEILDPLLPSVNPKKLELFSRVCRANYSSWGNEVIKFNELGFFEC